MLYFFQAFDETVFALEKHSKLTPEDESKLIWLFSGAVLSDSDRLNGSFLGPRKEMITPWSTNAVEITQNMGIEGIKRIERFISRGGNTSEHDPMLESVYEVLGQDLYKIDAEPEPVREITNIASYNEIEGLALSKEEITYLEEVSAELGRPLTDSEVFGFSQVNSEHCRHKIFNGRFIIDGQVQSESLFSLIKKTSKAHPDNLVSAYKDNVAFIKGPWIEQFAPTRQDKPDYFEVKPIESVISIKAETHNFPTTVEPFNGAATGSGGEIRDRMAGGTGSIPLAGSAVYMTSYPRLNGGRQWENAITERKWLYQTPVDILIKASNGASDFGNKFGQPLISGSLLTFEHIDDNHTLGYDKVIMLAGGIGHGRKVDSHKKRPSSNDKILVLGGDNYRIGMGGGAVSSVATGQYGNRIELNAIQRSNPEMQKRVYNTIRAMAELDQNPLISLHDHGAGGHLNCLSELVEEVGGTIYIEKLPIGDPTLSAREIIGNESQERMGLIISADDLALITAIAERERAPTYVVGDVTQDLSLVFKAKDGENPINLKLEHLFGSSPQTEMTDRRISKPFIASMEMSDILQPDHFEAALDKVLRIEAVACKDWLTNKVDRSVTGRVALQQCTGPLQLPLNNLGIMALDYKGVKGVSTAIGHAPIAALLDPAAGSRLSIAEALTNIIWAPIQEGISGVSLSANWMWPARKEGEDARLYDAVKAASDFAIELGVNIPTGKDSLSMVQKYEDGSEVRSPGTVIISAAGEVSDIRKAVTPVLSGRLDTSLIYLDMSGDSFKIDGSSFAQVHNLVGHQPPDVRNAQLFVLVFDGIQKLIRQNKILSGHDVSAGGIITALLEMTFCRNDVGVEIDIQNLQSGRQQLMEILFAENPGVIIEVKGEVKSELEALGLHPVLLGTPIKARRLDINRNSERLFEIDINKKRDIWFETSYLLDRRQCGEDHAIQRVRNYKDQELLFIFPDHFRGTRDSLQLTSSRTETTGVRAAIIREKGVNGDREMAYSLYLAGFEVKDVHMTDLISGREDLEDINLIVFVGGFSNSDVLGSAKGWAGAFLYNPTAKMTLDRFYSRDDTLSLGVCNGCQLMMELELLYPEKPNHPKMFPNASGKFESSFLNVNISANDSVMFHSLRGSRLGIWVAHGEGRFVFEGPNEGIIIVGTYAHDEYPGNPNGSDQSAAIISSANGRHVGMMPHLERSVMPWQWPWYPTNRKNDDVTPWVEAFANAREWIKVRTVTNKGVVKKFATKN